MDTATGLISRDKKLDEVYKTVKFTFLFANIVGKICLCFIIIKKSACTEINDHM